MFELEAVWTCDFCGEENISFIDPTGGVNQVFVEDCLACGHTNTVGVTVDVDSEEVLVETCFAA